LVAFSFWLTRRLADTRHRRIHRPGKQSPSQPCDDPRMSSFSNRASSSTRSTTAKSVFGSTVYCGMSLGVDFP
jgi:hypothetical protein